MKLLSIIAFLIGFPFLCAEFVIAQGKLTPQDGFYVPAGMNYCHFNVVNDEQNAQVFLFGLQENGRDSCFTGYNGVYDRAENLLFSKFSSTSKIGPSELTFCRDNPGFPSCKIYYDSKNNLIAKEGNTLVFINQIKIMSDVAFKFSDSVQLLDSANEIVNIVTEEQNSLVFRKKREIDPSKLSPELN